jgi:hypothetical protein
MPGSALCAEVIHIIDPPGGIAIRRKEQAALYGDGGGCGHFIVNGLKVTRNTEESGRLPAGAIPCNRYALQRRNGHVGGSIPKVRRASRDRH